MKLFQFKKVFLGVFVVLAAGVFSGNSAFAEAALEISPAKRFVELDPESSFSDTITLKNVGDNAIDFSIGIDPYQVENGSYNQIFTRHNQYTQIVDWIKISATSGHIEPGESFPLSYTVTVPKDAPAGDQYAFINFTTKDGLVGGNIDAAASIGCIVHAEVSGETRMEGSILGTSINGFLFTPPVYATVSLENTGNVSANSSTVMRITNFFTGAEAFSNANNPIVKETLPDTNRDIIVSWDDSPALGVFRVSITTSYLDSTSTESRVVVICPIWFIAIVIICAGAAVAAIVVRYRKSGITSASRFNG